MTMARPIAPFMPAHIVFQHPYRNFSGAVAAYNALSQMREAHTTNTWS